MAPLQDQNHHEAIQIIEMLHHQEMIQAIQKEEEEDKKNKFLNLKEILQ